MAKDDRILRFFRVRRKISFGIRSKINVYHSVIAFGFSMCFEEGKFGFLISRFLTLIENMYIIVALLN